MSLIFRTWVNFTDDGICQKQLKKSSVSSWSGTGMLVFQTFCTN